jgi:hypothetical protein
MNPTAAFTAFAQSVYLATRGRYYDSITSSDGQTFLTQMADWANMFFDELETELDPEGSPLNWTWNRENSYTIGTAAEGAASLPFPDGVDYLLADEGRYVQILQDGTAVSNWAVVNPSQISSISDRIVEDMVSVVGGVLVFSRAFLDYEDGGTVVGDVELPLPRIAFTTDTSGNLLFTNVKALTIVKPALLLKLGVAKNVTLPDIVQGGLSPSYTQKYADLLANAIARNTVTSYTDVASKDDLSYIGGVGF